MHVSSTFSFRATTKPSSTFTKLLALLREEHVKSLEAVHDEYRDMYASPERIVGLHRGSGSGTDVYSSERVGAYRHGSGTGSESLALVAEEEGKLHSDSFDYDDHELIPCEPAPNRVVNSLDEIIVQEESGIESDYLRQGQTSRGSKNYFKPVFAENFEARRAWSEMAFVSRDTMISRKSVGPVTFSDMFSIPDDAPHYSKFRGNPFAYLLLHPNSRRLLAWDVLGFFLIAYEMIVLPLQAFALGDNGFLILAEWTGRIFWTLDIFVSTIRGYFFHGRLFMSFTKTLYRYLRTWFVLDWCLVLIDWSLLVLDQAANSDQDNSIGVVRVLRVTRLARMLRVLRILKLKRLFSSLSDLIRTDILVIYFKFTKPLCGLLFLIHWIACGWYGIGVLSEEGGWTVNWLKASNLQERTKGYAYCTSLHWSITQFTLGAIDVHAQNMYERLYTVSVILLGVVAFSTLIGGFTSAVEEIREIRSEKTKQFSLLHSFLRDYSVSQNLMSRIQKHCEYTYKHQTSRLQESDVKLLELISEQLKQELAKEVFTPELKPHPLFQRMVFHRCTCLDKICRLALLPRSYAQGDMIFANDIATIGMIMFTDGQCNYVQRNADGGRTSVRIWKEEWMCEPVLWASHWLTHGKAKATAHSRAVFVDAYWFEKVFSEVEPKEWQLVHLYAFEFISMLNDLPPALINDLLPNTPEDKSDGDAGSFSHAVMDKIEWPDRSESVTSRKTKKSFATVVFGRDLLSEE